MGLQIYGNIDAGSLLAGKVEAVDNLSASGIKNLVAGDGLEVELFLTSQSGLVNIQDYSVRLGIGDINARPTSGTWDLGSVTGIDYNVNATTLQANITTAVSGNPANTTTQLSPFVFKTVFTPNGSQTIPTIDATGLNPSSTVSIVKLVEGDGSTQEQWLTRIFANPLSFQDTWTNFTKSGVGEGLSGALGLGTTDIYSQFSESVTSFTTTMEMEITDTSGNVTTVFQIPVTIGGETLGAGITVSSISPSNFVTATDVNTTVDSVTTRANQLFVSADRGSDATGTRNSTTKPYETFAGALADVQSGDTIQFMDGNFTSEGTQTITTNNINLFLEQGVTLPAINYNGTFLRVKGLGSLQQVGFIDTSGGSGTLIMEKLYALGLKLNATGSFRADKVDFPVRIEFATGSGTAHKYFNDCIINAGSGGEAVLFSEAGVEVFFDNCILQSDVADVVKITNATTAPSLLYLKDCLVIADSSYDAFDRSSTNTTVTLDFVGGMTGISYFSNPSDFTINGNYILQPRLTGLPYLFQQ